MQLNNSAADKQLNLFFLKPFSVSGCRSWVLFWSSRSLHLGYWDSCCRTELNNDWNLFWTVCHGGILSLFSHVKLYLSDGRYIFPFGFVQVQKACLLAPGEWVHTESLCTRAKHHRDIIFWHIGQC